MSAGSPPEILIHSRYLVPMLDGWEPGAPVHLPGAVAAGVPAEIADRVEILISGGDALPNALVDALPRLRLVACFSTGYAGIDLRHLRARGVQLTTAGGVNAHDVADHATALLLALWHGLLPADRRVREGGWRAGLAPRRSLRGRRIGVLGLGRIGLATADRLAAHDTNIRWWGPRAKPGAPFERADSLLALADWCDALIVTSRALPENAGQVGRDVLRALGPDGLLINVSRGMLIDETALREALRDGALGGAGLDVFADEPTDPALWRDLPNLVLSPHLAGYTREAGESMVGQLKENVRRQLAGEPLLTPVEDIL